MIVLNSGFLTIYFAGLAMEALLRLNTGILNTREGFAYILIKKRESYPLLFWCSRN